MCTVRDNEYLGVDSTPHVPLARRARSRTTYLYAASSYYDVRHLQMWPPSAVGPVTVPPDSSDHSSWTCPAPSRWNSPRQRSNDRAVSRGASRV
ncbi:hypothetical protein EVAR_59981_1 [Eumeta japonica]|uniref:Uncharacterized protein n=1 Tax=Eumeta variegata TaxID=151549 RepID=A0A4C2A685_EUMVA|nr:hypothetical protein EVAR_59981_1 [Eumeta japonica]